MTKLLIEGTGKTAKISVKSGYCGEQPGFVEHYKAKDA